MLLNSVNNGYCNSQISALITIYHKWKPDEHQMPLNTHGVLLCFESTQNAILLVSIEFEIYKKKKEKHWMIFTTFFVQIKHISSSIPWHTLKSHLTRSKMLWFMSKIHAKWLFVNHFFFGYFVEMCWIICALMWIGLLSIRPKNLYSIKMF